MRKCRKNLVSYNLLVFYLLLSVYGWAQSSALKVHSLSDYFSQIEDNKRDTMQAYALCRIAFHYTSVNSDSVLYYSIQSLQLSDSLNYHYGKGFTYSNIGLLKSASNQFSEAIQYYLLAEKEFLKENRIQALSGLYNNLGNLFFENNQNEKAIHYFRKAYEMLFKLNRIQNMAVIKNNIGMVFNELGSYDSAQLFLKESINLSKQSESEFAISLAYSNMANTKLALQQTDSFYYYSNRAEDIFRNNGNSKALADNLLTRAQQLIKESRKNEALKILKDAIFAYENFGELNGRSQCYYHLSHIEESRGKAGIALLYYQKYVALKDSFYSDDNVKKLTSLALTYENDRKQSIWRANAERVQLENEHQVRVKNIMIIVLTFVLLLILFFAYWVFKNLNEKKLQQKAILQQKEILQEKQTEVLDSIRYARRIQSALITSEKIFAKHYLISRIGGKL
jgi:tetratricopeptide (TPR) repeat protein